MSPWQPVEGETPIDLSDLKVRVKTRAELNALEFVNISKAIAKYLSAKPSRRMAPFNIEWCGKLHRQMFGDVLRRAGEFRTSDTNIGVPHGQVEPMLHNLMENLPHWKDRPLVEQAADLHHQAVAIHPFANGNGRWSRLLANIWLRRHAHPVIRWPEETIGSQSPIRRRYLDAIRAADAGNLCPLVELHETHATGG